MLLSARVLFNALSSLSALITPPTAMPLRRQAALESGSAPQLRRRHGGRAKKLERRQTHLLMDASAKPMQSRAAVVGRSLFQVDDVADVEEASHVVRRAD
jgi:hypothetical protein